MASSSGVGQRLCDLVMKGGITSGVVYPRAVARLSEHYRFKNIGGTSAGAIAAVCTAAAEYQRLQAGSSAGFEGLRKLSDELMADGKLLSLFQPAPKCRSLFRLLTMMLNAKGPVRRLALGLMGLVHAFPLTTLASLAVGVLLFVSNPNVPGAIGAVSLAVLAWAVGMVVRVLVDFMGAVVRNDYGLCPGLQQPGRDEEALVPWLHEKIQAFAGLPPDQPLTFGMLWDAPGFPDWLAPHLPPGAPRKSIDLQLFTTNLTHGRPYLLPFGNADELFYRREELAKYMPPEVMAHLERCTQPVQGEGAPPDLRKLPAAHEFPVLLAARLSLSFPILFSAIPLWAKDPHADLGLLPQQRKTRFERCIFSDGGLSSNFPVHLFDGLLPMWPTFGIDLVEAGKRPKDAAPAGDRELVDLPGNYTEGMQELWQRFDAQSGSFDKLAGFLGAMVNTMQNWNDHMLRQMPGVRDRVARLALRPDEGGLNLDMDSRLIDELGLRGECAADRIIQRYLPDDAGAQPGWDDQRWVRMAVTMSLLNQRLAGVSAALSVANPYATSFEDLLHRAAGMQMPGMDKPMDAEQIEAVLEVLQKLQGWTASNLPGPGASFQAVPQPDLRVRPSI